MIFSRMIFTVARIQMLELARDRAALFLTFLLPIVFFSIFVLVFSGGGKDGVPAIDVAIVDQDESELSERFIEVLAGSKALKVAVDVDGPAAAELMVHDGVVAAAVIVPDGWSRHFPDWDGEGEAVRLLYDSANPVASQMLAGLMQKAAVTAMPGLMMKLGIERFRLVGGPLTSRQQTALDQLDSVMEAGDGAGLGGGALRIEAQDLLGGSKPSPAVAFFAAGIGVMFLLFSCANVGGALLDERESGTLDRLMMSQLGMGGLLAGKWLFLVLLGVVQLTLMYAWGALFFEVELIANFGGFLVMTLFTAAAAASFGLLLATACHSRAQLGGVSTIVILTMSAVGGSMLPRFMMSETIKTIGLLTFNGWALDGYIKVFWRDSSILGLWPQLAALSLMAGLFMVISRRLARRWESC